jgi:hypothetical protein
VTQSQLQGFKYVAQYAASAYCNTAKGLAAGTPIRCGSNACPDVETNRAFTLGTFDSGTGTAGYVGVDPAERFIVVAFKGTDNVASLAYE